MSVSGIFDLYHMAYIQIGILGETSEDLLARTQRGMALWELLMRTTEGAIVVEPGKSDWVGIDFEQKKTS